MQPTLWCAGLFASIDPVPDASIEAVHSYMRSDFDAWGEADPMIDLSWHEGAHVSQLLVIRHPERGFYFEYSGYRDGLWLVAIDSMGNRELWVSNMSHGAEAFFLAACFLSQELSENVVTDFMASQRLSRSVTWVSFEPLCPRRDQLPRGGKLARD